MRRTTPDVWMFVLFVIAIIAIPIIVGMLLIKAYRKFRPLEQAEPSSNAVAAIHHVNHDGFFKVMLAGWLVCGPLFYVIYLNFLTGP